MLMLAVQQMAVGRLSHCFCFASGASRRLQRLNGRFPAPDTEASDALARRDWNVPACPDGEMLSREVNHMCSQAARAGNTQKGSFRLSRHSL